MRRILTPASLAIVITLSFVSARSSDAQSSVDDKLNSFRKETEAEIDQYLVSRPVRPSALFEAAGALMSTLGKIDVMIIDTCEYDPDFPDWSDEAHGLRENTILALGKSYLNVKRKYREETPPSQTVKDQSLCADVVWRHWTISRQLKGAFAALRKQGY
jgi:hypothetical protein